MSFFSSILDKLGFGSADKPAAVDSRAPEQGPPVVPPPVAAASRAPEQGPPAAPANVIPVVDVVAKLEGLAASNSQKLNWKTSIVDLLKLLGLDSSLDARKGLARELGCPQDKMNDSAAMNIWLHKTVLQKLAENGGNIPKELL